MTAEPAQYKYDVAISFLAEDEALAVAVADRLRDRYDVFVYSDHQKELGGRDGLEAFAAVFRREARVCVVLHREGWGNTKWTRIEETAIKERAFEEGWDFLLVVRVAEGEPPRWLPKVRIWLGHERYGVDGIAAAADARITEQGGHPRDEKPVDRAARLARIAAEELRQEQLLNSDAGVRLARAEIENLVVYLAAQAAEIKATPGNEHLHYQRRSGDFASTVGTPTASVTVGWNQRWGNVLRDARLILREFKGLVRLDLYGEGPKEESEELFRPAVGESNAITWVSDNDGRRLTSRQLVDEFLRRMLDRAHARRDDQW